MFSLVGDGVRRERSVELWHGSPYGEVYAGGVDHVRGSYVEGNIHSVLI